MSIIIHGMSLPKDGYIDVRLFSDGWAHIPTDEPPYYNKAFEANDVRPVVLCRDCRFYSNGFCHNPNTFDDEKTKGNTSPEWFCADGRRREGVTP